MQVFAAYIRRHAPWQADQSKKIIEPAADTQAVLNVIGRRSRYYKAGENTGLNLYRTDFANYEFPPNAHLEGVYLVEAHFENAVLVEAQLKEATLMGAHLEGAYLWKADLRGADLSGAHLEGAYLEEADLRGANLADTYLTATYLPGAKLQGAENLDPKRLEDANGARNTRLGRKISRPEWWDNLPQDKAPLASGDYSIKVWKTLLSSSDLGEGGLPGKRWYASLSLPYNFSLTPAGVYFAGPGIAFCSGPWVCDPQEPKNFLDLKPAPEDTAKWVAWFEKHPHLRLTREPDKWENLSGDTSGIQFYTEVDPHTFDNRLHMSPEGPAVSLFPTQLRWGSFGIVKGKKVRIIVLEREGETMLIVTESLPNEFDWFKNRVDKEVLANLYIGT